MGYGHGTWAWDMGYGTWAWMGVDMDMRLPDEHGKRDLLEVQHPLMSTTPMYTLSSLATGELRKRDLLTA